MISFFFRFRFMMRDSTSASPHSPSKALYLFAILRPNKRFEIFLPLFVLSKYITVPMIFFRVAKSSFRLFHPLWYLQSPKNEIAIQSVRSFTFLVICCRLIFVFFALQIAVPEFPRKIANIQPNIRLHKINFFFPIILPFQTVFSIIPVSSLFWHLLNVNLLHYITWVYYWQVLNVKSFLIYYII